MAEKISEKTKKMLVHIYALFLALGDRRVPWHAKAVAAITVGYAFSPIDLITEGLMDELRLKVQSMTDREKPTSWIAGAVVVSIWALAIIAIVLKIIRR
ncbi:MAG: hypothetical protein WBL79_05415 [Bacillota bacterium]|jgi:hypothetical protein